MGRAVCVRDPVRILNRAMVFSIVMNRILATLSLLI